MEVLVLLLGLILGAAITIAYGVAANLITPSASKWLIRLVGLVSKVRAKRMQERGERKYVEVIGALVMHKIAQDMPEHYTIYLVRSLLSAFGLAAVALVFFQYRTLLIDISPASQTRSVVTTICDYMGAGVLVVSAATALKAYWNAEWISAVGEQASC